MLAYELYRHTKKSGSDSGIGIPIKKIFVSGETITIDDTTISEYGTTNTPDKLKDFLQKNFDMPIDVNPKLNLPEKIVSSASPKPYVVIYGYINACNKEVKIDGQKQWVLEVQITLGKEKKKFAKMTLPDYKLELDEKNVHFKIDKLNYMSGNASLYDKYVNSRILKQDKLPGLLLSNIAKKFFDFLKTKQVDFIKGKTSFALYVLPDNKEITFEDKKRSLQRYKMKKNNTLHTITDSFGNTGEWTNRTTAGVTFITYDDKAFTINCNQMENFYKDISVGSKSLSKILLPENNAITMSGLEWYFLDLNHPKIVFSSRSKGIYDQLYHNYIRLKKGNMPSKSSSYKVISIKRTNAKREIIVNENLTMKNMEQMFSGVDANTIPYNAYECLIITRGKSTIYRYYFQAIKSLLNQIRFNKDQLDLIFTFEVKHIVREFLKENIDDDVTNFFKHAQFCYKTLYRTDDKINSLSPSEEFAFGVGVMTRLYVDFRIENGYSNNSLKNILSKQKYDVNTLHSVIMSIGRGIHLISLNDVKYNTILDKIRKSTPKILEKGDTNIRKDYSYYFYMGYFGESK